MARTKGANTMKPAKTGRYRAWQAMRIMRRFTIPEIAATAEVGISNITQYTQALVGSGHLRVARAKQEGRAGGHVVYAMARNTGPLQPVLRVDGTVYDANTGIVYGGDA